MNRRPKLEKFTFIYTSKFLELPYILKFLKLFKNILDFILENRKVEIKI